MNPVLVPVLMVVVIVPLLLGLAPVRRWVPWIAPTAVLLIGALSITLAVTTAGTSAAAAFRGALVLAGAVAVSAAFVVLGRALRRRFHD